MKKIWLISQSIKDFIVIFQCEIHQIKIALNDFEYFRKSLLHVYSRLPTSHNTILRSAIKPNDTRLALIKQDTIYASEKKKRNLSARTRNVSTIIINSITITPPIKHQTLSKSVGSNIELHTRNPIDRTWRGHHHISGLFSRSRSHNIMNIFMWNSEIAETTAWLDLSFGYL